MTNSEQEYHRLYRQVNKDKIRAYQKQYRELHRESAREYQQDYYEANHEKISKQQSIYHQENRPHRLEVMTDYRNLPENKVKASDYHKVYRLANKKQLSANSLERRRQRKSLVEAIALHYGCQNAHCQWTGTFNPCQLDFHHYTPGKSGNISQMYGCSERRIASEINKCVVLCRNCHQLHHQQSLEISESNLCKVTSELLIEAAVS